MLTHLFIRDIMSWRIHSCVTVTVTLLVLVSDVNSSIPVVIKLNKDVPMGQFNCQDTVSHIKQFFSNTSNFLHDATYGLVQFSHVSIQLPHAWNLADCFSAGLIDGLRRFPISSADVRICTARSAIEATQPEDCGKPGRSVLLGANVLQKLTDVQAMKQFATEWLKHEFGVFEEHGYSDSQIYPEYYRKGEVILPNSCSDKPVEGNFSAPVCLNDPNDVNCEISDDQDQISSSLLYSSDVTIFPEMSKVCNVSNHVQDSPNKHNLLCRYNSVLETIQVRTGTSGAAFSEPSFSIFADKPEEELIIIQDVGTSMSQDRHDTIRYGLEQLFIALNPITKVSVIRTWSEVEQAKVEVNVTEVGEDNNDEAWGDLIFKEEAPLRPVTLNLEAVFNEVANQLQYYNHPNILIITATQGRGENLTNALKLIEDNRLQVDVVTFTNVAYPVLLNLAKFGTVYAMPEGINDASIDRGYNCGSAMRQISSSVLNLNYQEVFYNHILDAPPMTTAFINGTFNLPNNVTSANPNPHFDVYFMSSWEETNIILVDPAGNLYTTEFGNLRIRRKWSDSVYYATDLTFMNGTWSYYLRRPEGATNNFGSLYVIAQIDVGNEIFGTGFNEQLAKVEVNATSGVFALALYAEVENSKTTNSYDIKCFVNRQEIAPQVELELLDNGLTEPDISSDDAIFSQYFYHIYYPGFYHTRYEMTSPQDPDFWRSWPGQSFYIQEPLLQTGEDRIPPSRITDLRILQSDPQSSLVTLTWTAPGDNLNEGEANHYKVYCGQSRMNMTYSGCFAFREQMIKLAHEAGTTEVLTLSLEITGVEVYVGIKAFDEANNAGEMSNIPSIFREGPTTSTTTTVSPTTTPATQTDTTQQKSTTRETTESMENPSSNNVTDGSQTTTDKTTDKPQVTMNKGGFIALMCIFCLLLLILIILLILLLCKRRKRREKKERAYRSAISRQIPPQPRRRSTSLRRPSGSASRRGHDPVLESSLYQKRIGSSHDDTSDVGSSIDSDSIQTSTPVQHRRRPAAHNRGYIGSPQIRRVGDTNRSLRRGRSDLEQLDAQKLMVSSKPRSRKPLVVAGDGSYQMQRRQSENPSTTRQISMATSSNAGTMRPEMDASWTFHAEPNSTSHNPGSNAVTMPSRSAPTSPTQLQLLQSRRHPYPDESSTAQPYNYIAFSQRVTDDLGEDLSGDARSTRAVSYV